MSNIIEIEDIYYLLRVLLDKDIMYSQPQPESEPEPEPEPESEPQPEPEIESIQEPESNIINNRNFILELTDTYGDGWSGSPPDQLRIWKTDVTSLINSGLFPDQSLFIYDYTGNYNDSFGGVNNSKFIDLTLENTSFSNDTYEYIYTIELIAGRWASEIGIVLVDAFSNQEVLRINSGILSNNTSNSNEKYVTSFTFTHSTDEPLPPPIPEPVAEPETILDSNTFTIDFDTFIVNYNSSNSNDVLFTYSGTTAGNFENEVSLPVQGHTSGQSQFIFYFNPAENVNVSIGFTGNGQSSSSTNFDTVLGIFDSNNNQIEYDDDSGDSTVSAITNYVFSKNINYKIVVSGYYSTSEGDFIFNIYKGIELVETINSFSITANDYTNATNNSLYTADGSISSSSLIYNIGSISRSGQNIFYFTPTINMILKVTTCNSLTNFDTVLALVDSSGNVLNYNDTDQSCSNNQASMIIDVMPNVRYNIVVAGYSNSIGTFRLIITRATDQEVSLMPWSNPGVNPYNIITHSAMIELETNYIEIPIAYHIIKNSNLQETYDDGTILDYNKIIQYQQKVLKIQYGTTGESMKPNTDPDFTPGGQEIKIRFVILTKDGLKYPDNNDNYNETTNNYYSLTETTNTNWLNGNNIYLDGTDLFANYLLNNGDLVLKYNNKEVCNVYCSNEGSYLGYATFPDQNAGLISHGIWLLTNSMPSSEADTRPNYTPSKGSVSGGGTLSHEIGHWLGLHHTFTNTSNCALQRGGERSLDTPIHYSPDYGSYIQSQGVRYPKDHPNLAVNDDCPSDPGYNPVYNIMNYGNDDSLTWFTDDQYALMLGSIWQFMNELWPNYENLQPKLLNINTWQYDTSVEILFKGKPVKWMTEHINCGQIKKCCTKVPLYSNLFDPNVNIKKYSKNQKSVKNLAEGFKKQMRCNCGSLKK